VTTPPLDFLGPEPLTPQAPRNSLLSRVLLLKHPFLDNILAAQSEGDGRTQPQGAQQYGESRHDYRFGDAELLQGHGSGKHQNGVLGDRGHPHRIAGVLQDTGQTASRELTDAVTGYQDNHRHHRVGNVGENATEDHTQLLQTDDVEDLDEDQEYGNAAYHSTHDLAVMRAIPDITIVLPSDNVSTEKLVRAIAVHDGPVYMRLGRGPVENFHSPDYEPVIGRGDVLRHGTDLTIVAAGEVTLFALEAGKALEDLGVSAEVIELATIKPLDAELVLRSAKKTGLVLTVEEHSVFGGLGGAVAELLSTPYPVPMKILGIPDEWAVVGSQREVFAHYGLDTAGIVAAAKAMLDANRV